MAIRPSTRGTIVAGLLAVAAVGAALLWATTRRERDVAPGESAGPVCAAPPAAPAPAMPDAPRLEAAPRPPPATSPRPAGTESTADGPSDALLGPSLVEGRLVDPDDRPLAAVPVYLAFASPPGREGPDQRILYVGGPDAREGAAEASRYESHGVTDAEGRFRLDATFVRMLSSGDGGVRVVPAHPTWMEARRSPATEGGLQRADRAVSLAVEVVDDRGEPIPALRAVVREPARRGDHAFAASNGGFVVQWRRGGDLPPTVSASLVVWAPSRRAERRDVTIPPERDRASVRVDLGPLLPPTTLVLRSPAAASPAPNVVVALSLPERADDAVERRAAGWRGDAAGGAWTASLPPGRFRVSAWAPSAAKPLLDEVVDLLPGATVERTVPAAAEGPEAGAR